MAIYPTIKTGGGNLEMAVESALGTPGAYLDFRHCDDADPAFPTDTREVRPVSSKGFWDPADRESQLCYEKVAENAGTVSCHLTGCSAAAATPQTVKLFEAMGCTIVAGSDTPAQIGTYTNTGSWSGTSGFPIAGVAAGIGDTADAVWPYLTYTNSGAAAYDIVPTMAIPVASTSDKYVTPMWTITPPKGTQVSSSKTLAFRLSSYFVTSTETGSCWVYTGCAPSEIKPIVFESGSPVKIECGLHIADRAFDRSGIDLTTPAYLDSVAIPFVDGAAPFSMGFAAYGAMPIASTRTTGFRKATWNPGIKTNLVMETGSSTAVNGLGSYIGEYTGSTIELVMDVNKDWWTAFELSSGQTAQYIELVQKSSSTANMSSVYSTAFGLWMPRCYLTGKPSADLWGEKEMTITATFEPTSARMVSTSKTAQANQPWYLAISPVY